MFIFGDVIFFGQLMSKLFIVVCVDLCNCELGFIYQFYYLLLDFSVLENVVMLLLIGKKKLVDIECQVKVMLQVVGFEYCSYYCLLEFFGGECQWVVIVCVLVNKLWLVLVDELIGNFDVCNVDSIFQLLGELNVVQCIVFLVVIYDLQLVKCMSCQLEMCDGCLIVDLILMGVE